MLRPSGIVTGGLLSVIYFRRQKVIRNLQLVAEKANFFRLGLEVFPLRVGQDKIEHSDASLNKFNFVLPAIADVLAVDLVIDPAREQVIHRSALYEVLCPGVFLGVKFVPEGVGAVTPMGIGENEKLARHKVPGMCRCDVEKTGFCFGVTQGLQGFGL